MQQATHVHSDACTGTSPENLANVSHSRRALLGFAGVGALALAAPTAAKLPQVDRWEALRIRWESASEAADSFYERNYQPDRKRIDTLVGKTPPFWFEHTNQSGRTARYMVDPSVENAGFITPICNDLHRKAADAWNEWRDRNIRAEAEPRWASISKRMDDLWGAEDTARKALFAEPAPHGAALALKVKLALGNDDLWDCDREALLADAQKMA